MRIELTRREIEVIVVEALVSRVGYCEKGQFKLEWKTELHSPVAPLGVVVDMEGK